MDEDLLKMLDKAVDTAVVLEGSDDPFQQEEGENLQLLVAALRRLRKVAIIAGVPDGLVDKIALGEM